MSGARSLSGGVTRGRNPGDCRARHSSRPFADQAAGERAPSEPGEAGEQGCAEPVPETGEQQFLVPGVRPISLKERLELRTQAPLQPRKLQQPLDIGLFDLAARSQLDLF